VKLTPTHSTGFNITYHKSYKTITTRAGALTQTYYAYLCGTPQPNLPAGATAVEIPIKSAGVTSTTYLPYVAYLGKRTTLHYVGTDHDSMNACVRKLFDEGQVKEPVCDVNYVCQISAADAANVSASCNATTGRSLDAMFYGAYDDESTLPALFPASQPPVRILMGETLELTARGGAEWLFVVAAFYNLDLTAQTIAADIYARYDCNSALAKAQTVKKQVMWGSFVGSTYYGTGCPSWQCTLVQSSGALLIDTSKATNITNLLTTPNVSIADFWVYPDGNWNDTSFYSNPPVYVSAKYKSQLDTLSVVQFQKVYDVLGRHLLDFFDTAKAEVDVLLLDVIQVTSGDAVVADSRKRVFLHNVFTEPAAPQGVRSGSDCPDASAPLFTDWLQGPCSLSGPPANITYSVPLCPAASQSGATVHALSVIVLGAFTTSLAFMVV
jgi:hypothetical protein